MRKCFVSFVFLLISLRRPLFPSFISLFKLTKALEALWPVGWKDFPKCSLFIYWIAEAKGPRAGWVYETRCRGDKGAAVWREIKDIIWMLVVGSCTSTNFQSITFSVIQNAVQLPPRHQNRNQSEQSLKPPIRKQTLGGWKEGLSDGHSSTWRHKWDVFEIQWHWKTTCLLNGCSFACSTISWHATYTVVTCQQSVPDGNALWHLLQPATKNHSAQLRCANFIQPFFGGHITLICISELRKTTQAVRNKCQYFSFLMNSPPALRSLTNICSQMCIYRNAGLWKTVCGLDSSSMFIKQHRFSLYHMQLYFQWYWNQNLLWILWMCARQKCFYFFLSFFSRIPSGRRW